MRNKEKRRALFRTCMVSMKSLGTRMSTLRGCMPAMSTMRTIDSTLGPIRLQSKEKETGEEAGREIEGKEW